ncbi:MAG: hypothetical protein V9E88_01795 [Ferruginibacter sp.]
MKKFQPDKLVFLFKDFSVNGLNYNMKSVKGNAVSDDRTTEDESSGGALVKADEGFV